MAGELDFNRKGFTFTWILENFEYCVQKTGKYLKSPTFIVDTFERSKWSIWIYPRGCRTEGFISLYLCREEDSKGRATIQIDFELAIQALDGSHLTSKIANCVILKKGEGRGFASIIKRQSLFADKSTFLPQGALTIQCKMWKRNGEIKMDGQCIARTHIGVSKRAFLWKTEYFSSLGINEAETYKLKSTSDDHKLMSLQLFLRSLDVIFIKFTALDKSIVFSTFQSSLVDSRGDLVDCGQSELWFSPSLPSIECLLSIPKDTLMGNKGLYLPLDTLTLFCEQTFSTGSVLEKIESIAYGYCNSFLSKNLTPSFIKTADIKASDLKQDLGFMLKNKILSDVKLYSGSEIILAHSFILSARSPVFRAMFQSDMKEKMQHQIVIEDLTPDTVRCMLLYMYTDSLEELEWETAYNLYFAADKYQVMRLKDKCSSLLKSNLSLSNACEILVLSDVHQDKGLKSFVQAFILKNDKNIINSSEWKILMRDNIHLAAETMLLRFKE